MNILIDNKIAHEYLFETTFMDAYVILEKHYPDVCTCSYCQDRKLEKPSLKLWFPKDRSRNSWRVLCWNKNNAFYFLRSTLPTWRWFIYFERWTNNWRFSSLSIGKNSCRSLISICKNSGLPTKFKYLESILWITFRAKQNKNVCENDSSPMGYAGKL